MARAPTTSNVHKCRLRTGVLRFTQRRTVAKDTKIALTRQILDVTEALGEPDIQPDRLLDGRRHS